MSAEIQSEISGIKVREHSDDFKNTKSGKIYNFNFCFFEEKHFFKVFSEKYEIIKNDGHSHE